MRAREVLQENYQESLETDLGNLLTGAKGSGASQIATDNLVQQLSGMGYSVNSNSLLVLLQRNPMVLNATPQMVQLTGAEEDQMGQGGPEDSAAQVSDMAQKANTIG